MLLHLDNAEVSMRLVYQLAEDLKTDQERVAMTQALTLDSSRPEMGLNGTYGLFASPQWWNSISDGSMPLTRVSGVIQRVFIAGQDAEPEDIAFELQTEDGSRRVESCYVNDRDDMRFFQVNHRVDIVYAMDELKCRTNPGGKLNVSEIVLEMAVSETPAKKAA